MGPNMQEQLQELLNPEYQMKQARYENARGAVVKAYDIAGNHRQLSADETVKFARSIIPDMEKDLNETIRILEEKNGNTKDATPLSSKLLGHS